MFSRFLPAVAQSWISGLVPFSAWFLFRPGSFFGLVPFSAWFLSAWFLGLVPSDRAQSNLVLRCLYKPAPEPLVQLHNALPRFLALLQAPGALGQLQLQREGHLHLMQRKGVAPPRFCLAGTRFRTRKLVAGLRHRPLQSCDNAVKPAGAEMGAHGCVIKGCTVREQGQHRILKPL